ncbi:MAG: hypothetical protein DSZ00_04105 [Gammaproteobacteria bacterium]|nr:MAG: hypothetical protein DSZ00_04105 [Gammaproteobacteria bacterium]RTZ79974.1 MAG: hypothetical protein DSZ01_02870 [Gammaproteobacteria bacterium]
MRYKVKRKSTLAVLLATLLASAAGTLPAKDQAAAREKAQQASEVADEAERDLALLALTQMSAYLRSLERYHVTGSVSRDLVLEDGQKLQMDKQVSLLVAEPDKLYMETSTAYGKREFYFDGKQFTVYLPALKYYAEFDAPGTLAEAILRAEEKHDIEFPFVDLFLWGTEHADFDAIEDAQVVGISQVNGISCNHFAFRQEEVDWQVCIKRGGNPLPLKLVITTKTLAEQPQYVAVMNRDTAPVIFGRDFSFQPRQGDMKIKFGIEDLKAAGKAGGKQ